MILTQFQVWPNAGGLLDQDPLFIERLRTYTVEKSAYDARQKAIEERKNPSNNRRIRRRG